MIRGNMLPGGKTKQRPRWLKYLLLPVILIVMAGVTFGVIWGIFKIINMMYN